MRQGVGRGVLVQETRSKPEPEMKTRIVMSFHCMFDSILVMPGDKSLCTRAYCRKSIPVSRSASHICYFGMTGQIGRVASSVLV